MLLRLAPEFELRRDVVPWLVERGCAAALGNAPGGRGEPHPSGRLPVPLSGRLRALPPAEEPGCGEAPVRVPERPPGSPQRELRRGAGNGGGERPLGPGERPSGARGLEAGKFAVLKEFLTCRKHFYTSAALYSLFLLPASSHVWGFLFLFSPLSSTPAKNKKKSVSITPSPRYSPFWVEKPHSLNTSVCLVNEWWFKIRCSVSCHSTVRSPA